uniref:Ovule protein n=1 Tax=Meloidogyne incognita TaxID=6306 RepID=A0A914KP38_MELIC
MEVHKDVFVFHSHFAFELSFNFHFVVTQPYTTVIHFFNCWLSNTFPHFFSDNIYLRSSVDNHFNIQFSKL